MSNRTSLYTLAVTAVLVMAASAAAPATAIAQPALCRGKLFFDSVYQQSSGDQFNYTVAIRNGTNVPLGWRLQFGGFGPKVSLFSPQLDSGATKLAPHTQTTIKFGSGTLNTVGSASVKQLFDVAPPPGAMAVTLSNCK
jgi:hypothetical protein